MKTALGQVPGQEKPGSKNKAPQVPGQKKPGTYSGPAEVPGWENPGTLLRGLQHRARHQDGKPRNFFTVGSGDAGQGPVDNILLVFNGGRWGVGLGPKIGCCSSWDPRSCEMNANHKN